MGPTVAIWLPNEASIPTPEQLLGIARKIDRSAQSSIEISVQTTRTIGGTVELQHLARPFGFNIGEVGFSPEELKTVEHAFGFLPVVAIHIFAYANSPEDHRILAELALFFARSLGGIIDFGGNLGAVKARPGKLLTVPYSPGSIPSGFHVADVAFLQDWLAESSFHMVK